VTTTTPLSRVICHLYAAMVHVTKACLIQGWFATLGLALSTTRINLSTKFEVSISAHYKDMKGDTKYRKTGWFGVVWGHSRSLEIAPFDRVLRLPISVP